MSLESCTDESVDAVHFDGSFDQRSFLGIEGVEAGGEVGPAARRGQLVDSISLLLSPLPVASGLRQRSLARSRFISWFKRGSGDMGVTPLARSCHPVACRPVTPRSRTG